MRIFACLALLAAALPAVAQDALPPPVADHHLHIQGPDITATLRKMQARLPDLFKNIDPGLLDQHTRADALRALDRAGIEQGVLLSQAYTFASPYAAPDHPDIQRLTRRENAYNVRAALESSGRLKTFVSINPLDRGALAELRYWAGRDGVTGLKLHLGNSRFDPKSDAHVAKLAQVFAAARKAHLPIVIHVRNDARYDLVDAQRFITAILPEAGDLPVQVAHAGGGGGLDESTLDALAAYEDAIERGAPGTRNLVFDLAVVVINDKTEPALLQRLASLIRRIGPARFVMGSDWPSVPTPEAYYQLLLSQVPLTSAEWRVLLANRAPYLH